METIRIYYRKQITQEMIPIILQQALDGHTFSQIADIHRVRKADVSALCRLHGVRRKPGPIITGGAFLECVKQGLASGMSKTDIALKCGCSRQNLYNVLRAIRIQEDKAQSNLCENSPQS